MIKHSNEYLLNNYLDKYFQDMLFPLNLMQFVVFQQRYRIFHGFVTPNGVRAQVMSMLGALLLISLHLLHAILLAKMKHPAIKINISGRLVINLVISIAECLIVFVVHVNKTLENVQSILKMKAASKLMSINQQKAFQKSNWIFVIAIIFVYFLIGILAYAVELLGFTFFLKLFSSLYFDVNIIFATRMITFLVHSLKLWKEEMNGFSLTCPETNQLENKLTELRVQGKKLFQTHLDIHEAFNICGSVFRVLILLLLAEIFIQPLSYIQTFIALSGDTHFFTNLTAFSIISASLSLLWVVKDFMLLICVCAACQQFYDAVGDAEAACDVILGKENCLVDVRRLCKNVRRVTMCARAAGGLRAGGVVAVDAALPLRLLALLATYTVVLLQFAWPVPT